MKNRVLNGTVMTFHSIAFWISAAFIVRMIIAVVKVFEIESNVRYSDTFGDGYSVLLLFIAGFLSYRKHTGLSVSVNLSPYKMILSLTLASVVISLLFSSFDMIMVKWYFTEVDGTAMLNPYWTFAIPDKELAAEFFSATNIIVFIKLSFIYSLAIPLGYFTRHMLFSKPSLIIFRFASLVTIYLIIVTSTPNLQLVLIILILLIFLAITLEPTFFIFGLLLACEIEFASISLFVILLIWLVLGVIIAYYTNKYKVKLPQEKRKGLIL